MTPEQKAEELVRKYYNFGLNNPAQSFSWYECKQCALIAVHEIIKLNINDRAFVSEDKDNNTIVYSTYNEYWSEVLIEISKL